MNIKFFSDPSHGWGEVPIQTLKDLKIYDRISNFSYKQDDMAYLEEDCDLPLFLREMERQGVKVNFDEYPTNDDCWVRSLRRFS